MIAQRHVVLCGLGELGIHTLERLLAFGESVVVVDPEPPEAFARRCATAGVRLVVGSGRDPAVLREAGLMDARALLALAPDDMENLSVALAAHDLRPGLQLVVRLFNERLAQKLDRELEHCRVLDVAALAAPIFAYAGLHTDVHHVVDVPGGRFLLRRWRGVAPPVGARVLLSDATGTWGFMSTADAGGPGEAIAFATHMARRLVRVARKLVRVASQDVMLLVFVFMALMVVVGIDVLQRGMGLSWHHAAYFVISTMTTTGYGDISAKDSPAWVLAYVVGLMLMGSIVMAVLSAYFTEKLLALRMGALFGRKPLPTRGHFVIAGLGTVGFRIAAELTAAGHTCVGLERDTESRLVERARRAGIPVVVASDVFAALGDVYLEDARGVIAVTNEDATNLEIALMTQEAAPNAAVVARLFDPGLAAHLERAFGINAARSPSAIAAPAFAVAAGAPELFAAFDVGPVLYAVGLVRLAAGHPWVGLPPAALAAREALPLTWRPAGGPWTAVAPEQAGFSAGDEVVVVAPRQVWAAAGATTSG